MPHTAFATTTRGLRRTSPPMVLFEKAKRIGVWDPSDIDFTQDLVDWPRLAPDERDAVLRLTASFAGGEEAVTLDLLPLMLAINRLGWAEESVYMTSFLWEEAKHADFFDRFLTEVAREDRGFDRYHLPCYRAIFYDALPAAMDALIEDPSPRAIVRASTTYNLVVEGIIAETGYHAYFLALNDRGLMPGTRAAVTKIKQDEARHIAFGIYLLSRLISAEPALWDVVQETMNEMLALTMGMIHEMFEPYDVPPFGQDESVFQEYAMRQFGKRLDRLDRARTMSLASIEELTRNAIEDDDA
ncbi:MAG: R2-like ligand-binding oxidase [Candidatus Hydrogenedentes bacterium]|nr:R2-like ligand-binding oxidase [Candidatus Hydrogenedentota bacterium]